MSVYAIQSLTQWFIQWPMDPVFRSGKWSVII